MKLRQLYTILQWITFAKNWWVPILLELNMYKPVNQEIVIKTRSGKSLYFPYLGKHTNVGMISEIFFYKAYHFKGFIPKNNWNIIDIGANMGIFTYWCYTHAPHAILQCYEPVQRNFEHLLKNIDLLGENITVCYKRAVSSEDKKELLVYHSAQSDNCHSLYKEWTNNLKGTSEFVSCISLKKIIKQQPYVNLLKIDAEGAEWDIIMNTPPKIFQKIERIVVEWHNITGHSLSKFMNRLRQLGYNYQGNKGHVQFWMKR